MHFTVDVDRPGQEVALLLVREGRDLEHRAQERVGRIVIAPAGTIALLAGFYLASDRDYMGKIWVIVPLIILIGLLALGGAFFGPSEKRAAELSRRDVAAAGDGAVTLSPEYHAVAGRIAKVGALANVLVEAG